MILKKKTNLIAVTTFFIIALAAVTANLWLPVSPGTIAPDQRLTGPSAVHWFGTDDFGRDVFARTIVAARVSLAVGLIVAVTATVIGTVIGLASGYFKKVDFILMRIIDGFLAFPAILLALALVAALGGSMTNIIIALTLAFFPVMARVVRSAALQVKNEAYIEAARTSGVSHPVIIMRYILPNILSPVIVQSTFIFAKAILAEAALSFLGVGVNPSTPTWGNMLQEAQIYLTIAPWYSIFPGLAIVITVLALNLFGDGLRDANDPRQIKQKRKLKAA
ncbi:ABC transporter permease [Jeotgalibacillus haloalkalitolerans]|uniref:ABC transporter permease n=1 Tax=Jeotgalibacillus haloalkalitolerans TaxID=3104292 RepID=A0ABU5KNN9_9BACL|nr:ABC transporter permease [Jeotgalibacillus sp. HH7-29]MDZ5712769.1 ABC transporter permease [Jeotgalibacillus sp. HH7-29]